VSSSSLAFSLSIAITLTCITQSAIAGGFDIAISAAKQRVVKLYGAKIGNTVGYGTGIIVSPDGLVLTAPTILLDSDRIRAILPDGSPCTAEVLYVDDTLQLAALRLKPQLNWQDDENENATLENLPYFDLKNPGDIQPGDWVIAAGNPHQIAEGAEPVTVMSGIFSGWSRLDARRRTRDYPYQGKVLVIDAITSNPGAPGGALVNLDGQIVGMTGRVVTSNMTHTNFNFAMPAEILAEFTERAIEPEKRLAHRKEASIEIDHGLKLWSQGYQKNLVFVDRVKRNSPARRAGFRKNDRIVTIDGINVATLEDFDRRISAHRPGDSIPVTVMRGEIFVTLSLELEPAK
jgi:serine protease Do